MSIFFGTVCFIITMILLLIDCIKGEQIKKDDARIDKKRSRYDTLIDRSTTYKCEKTVKQWVYHDKSILAEMGEEIREILKSERKDWMTDREILEYLHDAQRIKFLASVLASKHAVIHYDITSIGVQYFSYNETFVKGCYRIIKRNLLEKGYNVQFCIVRNSAHADNVYIEDCIKTTTGSVIFRI